MSNIVTTIRIDEKIKRELNILSAKKGLNQTDLINKFILQGIKEEKADTEPELSLEEIEHMLREEIEKDKKNNITGKKVDLKDLEGIIESETDSVTLKKQANKSLMS